MRAFLVSFFIVFLSVCFFVSRSHATEIPTTIDRFYEVAPGIYRGARPEWEGMKFLAFSGFKSVLNLDDDRFAIMKENHYAQLLGLKGVSSPLASYWFPEDEQVNEILAFIANPDNHPVFIHCQHGRDRTGMIVGLYRVLYEGWTPQDAYSEMLNLGFRTMLVPLDHYFKERTGL